MLIYLWKRIQHKFQTGLPPGAWAEIQETGWITTELFLTWFKKFTGTSKWILTLLVLDDHKTHTNNLKLIWHVKRGCLALFAPRCSHRLQPLDRAFMKPLSTFYEEEVRTWLRPNPGKVVTPPQISSSFSKAFIHSATTITAVNVFRKTGFGLWTKMYLEKLIFSHVQLQTFRRFYPQ